MSGTETNNLTSVIDIPLEVLRDWQEITTLVADYCSVPACLVMRGNLDSMEVIASSAVIGNPYSVKEKEPRKNTLYCETVIEQQSVLEVPDSNIDVAWKDNPDAQIGMIAYYGVPVNWSSGENFGTFCILDRKPKHTRSKERRLIDTFAKAVENHLRLIELNIKHQYDASHDPLTGIFNRRIFMELAKGQIESARRASANLGLVLFDVDFFKEINDTLGHSTGDTVLRAIAETVGRNLREGELFARFGGEEFVILGSFNEAKDVLELANRVRLSVSASPAVLEIVGRPVTISCGCAHLKPEESLDSLLNRADTAMYEAKGSNRNASRVAP